MLVTIFVLVCKGVRFCIRSSIGAALHSCSGGVTFWLGCDTGSALRRHNVQGAWGAIGLALSCANLVRVFTSKDCSVAGASMTDCGTASFRRRGMSLVSPGPQESLQSPSSLGSCAASAAACSLALGDRGMPRQCHVLRSCCVLFVPFGRFAELGWSLQGPHAACERRRYDCVELARCTGVPDSSHVPFVAGLPAPPCNSGLIFSASVPVGTISQTLGRMMFPKTSRLGPFREGARHGARGHVVFGPSCVLVRPPGARRTLGG